MEIICYFLSMAFGALCVLLLLFPMFVLFYYLGQIWAEYVIERPAKTCVDTFFNYLSNYDACRGFLIVAGIVDIIIIAIVVLRYTVENVPVFDVLTQTMFVLPTKVAAWAFPVVFPVIVLIALTTGVRKISRIIHSITSRLNKIKENDIQEITHKSTGKVLHEVHSDTLKGVRLIGATLVGANLIGANLFRADLRNADLHNADLCDANLRNADLSNADLRDVDLRNTDLRGANLHEATLRGADLRGAKLTDGDWVPIIPDIHKAVLAAVLKPKALDMELWHTCETTHCWAGWIVTLAGSGGRVMEGVLGTGTAAAFILMASDPALERIPNWMSSDEVAMSEIKRLAARDL